VRELENLLHRALALSGAEAIDADDLGLPESLLDESPMARLDCSDQSAQLGQPETSAGAAVNGPMGELDLPLDLAAYLDEIERSILQRMLERHGFNRTAAGAKLGLSLRQIRYRMARLGIKSGEAPGLGA
jgi:two-component system response regulator PilR (NtrC family)